MCFQTILPSSQNPLPLRHPSQSSSQQQLEIALRFKAHARQDAQGRGHWDVECGCKCPDEGWVGSEEGRCHRRFSDTKCSVCRTRRHLLGTSSSSPRMVSYLLRTAQPQNAKCARFCTHGADRCVSGPRLRRPSSSPCSSLLPPPVPTVVDRIISLQPLALLFCRHGSASPCGRRRRAPPWMVYISEKSDEIDFDAGLGSAGASLVTLPKVPGENASRRSGVGTFERSTSDGDEDETAVRLTATAPRRRPGPPSGRRTRRGPDRREPPEPASRARVWTASSRSRRPRPPRHNPRPPPQVRP